MQRLPGAGTTSPWGCIRPTLLHCPRTPASSWACSCTRCLQAVAGKSHNAAERVLGSPSRRSSPALGCMRLRRLRRGPWLRWLRRQRRGHRQTQSMRWRCTGCRRLLRRWQLHTCMQIGGGHSSEVIPATHSTCTSACCTASADCTLLRQPESCTQLHGARYACPHFEQAHHVSGHSCTWPAAWLRLGRDTCHSIDTPRIGAHRTRP